MTRRRLLTGRPLVGLLCVLLSVALADGLASATSYVVYRDAPPRMPHFVSSSSGRMVRTIDVYSPMPAVYHYSATDLPSSIEKDGNGRFLYHIGTGAVVYPEVNAGYALDAMDRFRRTRDRRWLDRAEAATNQVIATGRGGLYPHDFDTVNDLSQPVAAPWFSAQSQGLMLSVLVRLRQVTGERRWGRLADQTFRTFLRFRDFADDGGHFYLQWISTVDERGYLWFEKYPSAATPTKIVTAHNTALIGLYDYWRTTRNPRSREAAEPLVRGGFSTLVNEIPRIRRRAGVALISTNVGLRELQAHRVLQQQVSSLAEIADGRVLDRDSHLLAADIARPYYLAGPYPPRVSVDVYAPWPAAYGYSALRLPPQVTDDGSGRLFYRVVGRRLVNPDVNAGYALDALDRYRVSKEPNWLSRAVVATDQVLNTGRDGLYPHEFDTTDDLQEHIGRPWYSAGTQGLMLSVLVRLRQITGNRRWSDAAARTFATLMRFRSYPDVRRPLPAAWTAFTDDEGFLWFEKYPSGGAPTRNIAAHDTAAIGVYDYWRLTHDGQAAKLLSAALLTVARYLPEIRQKGGLARIGPATLKFDRLQNAQFITQLDAMSRISARPFFESYARRLRTDADNGS